MKKTGLYITLVLFLSMLMQNTFAQQKITLVPNPQEISFKTGSFELNEEISIQVFVNDREEESFLIEQIQKEFSQSLGFNLKDHKTNSQIIVGVKGADKEFDKILNRFSYSSYNKLGKEGYRLFVTTDLILIAANSEKGTFYGVQTLKQLIRTERLKNEIPALEIIDWPDLEI
ncbi:MAG: glycoside hydrolase family 20 zincin-like fold domain-containing protein, partial [Balneola sp.]